MTTLYDANPYAKQILIDRIVLNCMFSVFILAVAIVIGLPQNTHGQTRDFLNGLMAIKDKIT